MAVHTGLVVEGVLCSRCITRRSLGLRKVRPGEAEATPRRVFPTGRNFFKDECALRVYSRIDPSAPRVFFWKAAVSSPRPAHTFQKQTNRPSCHPSVRSDINSAGRSLHARTSQSRAGWRPMPAMRCPWGLAELYIALRV